MDRKSLGYLASHEWVHIEGGQCDDRHHPVCRRTIDRPDHDRASRGGNEGHGRQDVRRDRKREGGERSLCAGERRGDRSQRAPSPSNVQLLAEDPFDKGWLIKVRLDQPPQTAELLDLDSYEKKVAEEAH